MTTVNSWPKTLPMPSVVSWNSTTETHLVFRSFFSFVLINENGSTTTTITGLGTSSSSPAAAGIKKRKKINSILFTKFSDLLWEKKCSSDRETLLKFKAEAGEKFAKILRSLGHFIWLVKGQNNFWNRNAFLANFWKLIRSNKLEQLEVKLEKIIKIKKHTGKVKKKKVDGKSPTTPVETGGAG